MKKTGILLWLLLITTAVFSQDTSLFERKWMINGNDTLPYRILLPENYDPAKKYPLVLFLHGSGERGNDNVKQLVHGSKLFLNEKNRKAFPAIVVFPQCPESSYWANVIEPKTSGKSYHIFLDGGAPTKAMQLLQQLLKQLLKDYPVQKKQVYVGGLSMGGMGTFELVRRVPGIFAAAFPICGGAHPNTAKKITGPAWWIFHGGKDDVVLTKFSIEMAAALKQAKATVKLTIYPDANHNSWDSTFAEPGLLSWVFSQHK